MPRSLRLSHSPALARLLAALCLTLAVAGTPRLALASSRDDKEHESPVIEKEEPENEEPEDEIMDTGEAPPEGYYAGGPGTACNASPAWPTPAYWILPAALLLGVRRRRGSVPHCSTPAANRLD